MNDIQQGDAVEVKPNIEQEDVNEVRQSIDQIDFIGTDVTAT